MRPYGPDDYPVELESGPHRATCQKVSRIGATAVLPGCDATWESLVIRPTYTGL